MSTYYFDNDYQNQINFCEDIILSVSDLNGITIPEGEENGREVASVQRDLENASSNIDSNIQSLLLSIHDQIKQDLENSLTRYAQDVNNGHTEDSFPFSDWRDCAKFKKKKWYINYEWLSKSNNFNLDSQEKIIIFLENISDYMSAINYSKSSFLAREIKDIENYINANIPQHKNFYSAMLMGQEYEYINTIRNNSVYSIDNAIGWSSYASNILHSEIAEDKNNLIVKFKYYLNAYPENKQKTVEVFLELVFNDNTGFSYSKGNKIPNMYSLDINWNAIKNLFKQCYEHDINLEPQINTQIEKYIKKTYLDKDQDQIIVGYKDFLAFCNALKLDSQLSSKLEQKKTHKI